MSVALQQDTSRHDARACRRTVLGSRAGQTPLHLLYESQDRVARHLTTAAFGMVSQVARVPSIARRSVERGASARAALRAEAIVAIDSDAAESASPPPQQVGSGGSDALRASAHAPHESKESNGSSAGLVAKPSVQSMMGTRSGLAPAASKSAIVDFERRLASVRGIRAVVTMLAPPKTSRRAFVTAMRTCVLFRRLRHGDRRRTLPFATTRSWTRWT